MNKSQFMIDVNENEVNGSEQKVAASLSILVEFEEFLQSVFEATF